MITSVGFENFKCFGEMTMCKLAPITLLVGENNSGKSSIIQALHLPALTIQQADPDTCLRLQHQDYDYGSFGDIVFRHDESKLVTLSFGNTIQSESDEQTNPKKEEIVMECTFGYFPRRQEVYLHHFAIKDGKDELLNATPRKYKDSARVLIHGHEHEQNYVSRFFKRSSLFVRPRQDAFVRLLGQNDTEKKKTVRLFGDIFNIDRLTNHFIRSFNRTYLLGPLRLAPSRFYAYSGSGSERIGPKGEFAFQNYATLLRRNRKIDREKIEKINQALYQLGFMGDLEVRIIKGKFSEFWTKHSKSSLTANVADAGFGISQVLPVIVLLHTSPPDSTILLEQPEIHLHPAAQAQLGSVLAGACSPRKRIVIETHSENLILRIQTEVAKRRLKPEDVRIYYVQPKSSGHKVIPIPLNEKGEFLAKWPKGFFEENYQESVKLAKARLGD